jgi:hypothetical protein
MPHRESDPTRVISYSELLESGPVAIIISVEPEKHEKSKIITKAQLYVA